MNLLKLLQDIPIIETCVVDENFTPIEFNLQQVEIASIEFDSRKVGQNTLFVAQVGVHVDGHAYIDGSISKGAVAVVCQVFPAELKPHVVYIRVQDSNQVLGLLASNFYGNPSRQLKLIGITGTNGKTTTVTLLHRMFRMAGFHVGLLSTIVNQIDEEQIPSTHTTPDAVAINQLLCQMVEAGCQYCFMEVSSHSVVQHRIAGLHFAGGIFSNITHDHLDFHKTMAEYIKAKKGFFDLLPGDAFALTNVDDKNGMVMVQNTAAKVYRYSLQSAADLRCKIVESTFEGLLLKIEAQLGSQRLSATEVHTQLVGRFNGYNLMAIYGTAVLCGIDPQDAIVLLSQLKAAEGRFEYVKGRGVTAIVDYAHTPDALDNVISTINAIRLPHQYLTVVVGCGGDRDPLKRPVMAKIGAQGSNRLILTSDNPRTEDPDAILDQMEEGLTLEQKASSLRITDRRAAIKTACMMAKEGDIILVAGKGHEKYQEINGVRHHFDDREELEKILLA